jgi:phosphatidylglycerophosphate synthase
MRLSSDEFDVALALIAVMAAALTLLAYAVSVVRHGRLHYERVERQDHSLLMGHWLMHAGYWALQPVARALVACRVGPDQLSWASLAAAIVAGAAMSSRRLGLATVSGAVSGVLDVLDGMVARQTGVASAAGEVLDASMDRCAEFAFLAGVVVAYREHLGRLVLALFALFGSFMVSYSTAKAEALSVTLPPGAMRRPARAFWLLVGAAGSAVTAPWAGSPQMNVPGDTPMIIALGIVAVVSNVSAARRLRALSRLVRHLGGCHSADSSPTTRGPAAASSPPQGP